MIEFQNQEEDTVAKADYLVVRCYSVSNPAAVSGYLKFVGPMLPEIGIRRSVAGRRGKFSEA